MPGPSAERAAELNPFWESVSIHESGHAVVGVLLEIPVHHIRLRYEQVGVFGRWEVAGYTAIGTDGAGADIHERDSALFVLAGLEAEALWLNTQHGIPLGRARAQVEARRANRGDVDELAASLPGSGITFDQALGWVNSTLCDQWQAITYAAAALREHQHLTGADIARLV